MEVVEDPVVTLATVTVMGEQVAHQVEVQVVLPPGRLVQQVMEYLPVSVPHQMVLILEETQPEDCLPVKAPPTQAQQEEAAAGLHQAWILLV